MVKKYFVGICTVLNITYRDISGLLSVKNFLSVDNLETIVSAAVDLDALKHV